MDVLSILMLPLAVIGGWSSYITIKEKCWPRPVISWKQACDGVRNLEQQLIRDQFIPDLIVGIGRGGAITGALLSGCLGDIHSRLKKGDTSQEEKQGSNIPLLVIDRKYIWDNQKYSRSDGMLDNIDISDAPNNILLVAGELHSGGTAKFYTNYFESLGAIDVRMLSLVTEPYPKDCKAHYHHLVINNRELKLPWHLTENYKHDSMKPC